MAAKKRSSRRGHSRRGSRRPVRRHGDGQPDRSRNSFERGWDKAIWLWKDGYTWELITHKADEESASGAYEYARGMVASVEAMSGWVDLARREAKAYGVPSPIVEALVARAVSA